MALPDRRALFFGIPHDLASTTVAVLETAVHPGRAACDLDLRSPFDLRDDSGHAAILAAPGEPGQDESMAMALDNLPYFRNHHCERSTLVFQAPRDSSDSRLPGWA